MNTTDLTHPAAGAVWWENEEERELLAASAINFAVCDHLLPDHPRDAFMAMMVGIECYLKYVYAVTRYNAINDVNLIQQVLRFLKITSPNANQMKCASLKHDIGKVISELRMRYRNLAGRTIQDFLMSLPPAETSDFGNLRALSWMAFRYRDGNDPAVKAICTAYITDLRPKFDAIRANYFGGLV
jgi:hypothetical protein